MTLSVYAGSFDPPHLGHIALIETAARACDELVVVTVGNPNKRTALLARSQRRDLLAAGTAHAANVTTLEHEGLTAYLAAELGASFLVRAMHKECVLEIEMAAANELISGIPTVFFPPSPATAWISSRLVRSELRLHGVDAVAALVPAVVLDHLRREASVGS